MKIAAMFSVFLLSLLNAPASHAQSGKAYSYLLQCYKGAEKDKGDMEIEGIGEVSSVALTPEGLQSSGLTYFEIPKAKQSMKSAKIAKTVVDYHIDTWKNNSKIIKNKQYHDGKVSINDLRLHLKIEDTDFQIIIISEGSMVYQLMSFQDKDEKDSFDSLLIKIRQHQCP